MCIYISFYIKYIENIFWCSFSFFIAFILLLFTLLFIRLFVVYQEREQLFVGRPAYIVYTYRTWTFNTRFCILLHNMTRYTNKPRANEIMKKKTEIVFCYSFYLFLEFSYRFYHSITSCCICSIFLFARHQKRKKSNETIFISRHLYRLDIYICSFSTLNLKLNDYIIRKLYK